MKYVVIVAAFLAISLAPGATLRQLSMDEMTQSATAVVKVRVTGISTSFTGQAIYTHYKLQMEETWKGPSPTEVMVPGGTAKGFKQSVPGAPQLQIGSEYVMFLWTSPATGITHLVGLTQGLFNVGAQSDGSVLAFRNRIGETMLDRNGLRVNDQAVSMTLSQMKNQVAQSQVTR